MRIAFFGCTNYSLDLLKILLKNKYDIPLIFTLPEEFKISYSHHPVRVYNYADLSRIGKQNRITVILASGRIDKYCRYIQECSCDLILVLGWYYMLPQKMRNIPPKGCLGIHASLLPKYAGGAPLVWAIINGEKESGVTLFYLDDGIDRGDIIAQKGISINYEDNISEVYDKATQASSDILLEYLPLIEKGIAPCIKQDLTQRTEYAQRSPDDGKIDWAKPAEEIRNFIRAQTRPYPGAFSQIDGEKITIWEARVLQQRVDAGRRPGEIIEADKDTFSVVSKDNILKVTDYDPKGIITSYDKRLLLS